MGSSRIKYFISLLTLISLSACESDVSLVNLPEFKQKLAISAFISPSETISYFFVTSNKNLYGELNTEEPLGNLTGFISNDSIEVALETVETGFKISHEKMPIKYGKTYELRVSSENGLSAEATCTVPERRSFSLKADTLSVVQQYSPGQTYRQMNIIISFTDYPGEVNFYRLAGEYIGYHTYPGSDEITKHSESLWLENDLFNDNGMDGKEITQSITGFSNSFYYYDSALIKIYLFNTEKSYYLYHKSMNNYNNSENPFSEVTPVFSNVTGGLGIFTSYTADSVKLKLK